MLEAQRFAATHNVSMPREVARKPILLPKNLSLRDNYAETVGAVAAIRQTVLAEARPVMIYFDRLETLEPAAALLLTAEIFRCRNLVMGSRHGRMAQGNYPANTDVFLQLREMGFFAIIGVDDRASVPDWEDRKGRPFFSPFHTFNRVESTFAAEFCRAVIKAAFAISDVAMRRMTAALKEAMGNAHEHGYKEPTGLPTMKGRWWLSAYVDPIKKEMMITLLDQGAGIPRILEATLFEKITSMLTARAWTPSDGHMIAAATELHRTSTEQAGRGKGFRDMKSFIQACDDGELRVLSNRGAYCYKKNGEHISDEELSIGGTIVEWRVRHAELIEVQDGQEEVNIRSQGLLPRSRPPHDQARTS